MFLQTNKNHIVLPKTFGQEYGLTGVVSTPYFDRAIALISAGTAVLCFSQNLPANAEPSKSSEHKKSTHESLKAEQPDAFHEVHHHIVNRRFKLAAERARVLAVKGHPKAQTVLGMLYQTGLGVEKDIKVAIYWLEKAAGHGLREAESYLGHLYAEGRYVEKDLDKAEHWLLKAAQHGERNAQLRLGLLYMDETWAKKDVRHAEIWLREAALQGSEEAKKELDKIPVVKAMEKRTQESARTYSTGLYSIKDSWAGYGEIIKSVNAASAATSGP